MTASTLSTAAHVVPHPHVLSVGQGDRIVLLNAKSGRYYSLNRSGADIWAGICAGQSQRVIAEQIARRYAMPIAVVVDDVRALLIHLIAASLAECPEPTQ